MSTAIRKLIPHIPTPSRDHRQNETTTLLEQHRVEARIAPADLVGHMSNVELDRASAARLEVDEEQAVPRTKQVAGMRLAVQQRVGAHLAAKCLPPAAERVEEQRPISIKERRRVVSIRQESPAAATRSVKCGASTSSRCIASCMRYRASAYSAGGGVSVADS